MLADVLMVPMLCPVVLVGYKCWFKLLQPLLNGPTAYLHCEALTLQKLSADLNEVLKIVVKIVNFIKIRLMKDQLFQHLSNELKAKYNNNLLFYHNSKWLSQGKVHFCVYKLRNKIIIHNLKKLLQSEMMRYCNKGCFMLISIS